VAARDENYAADSADLQASAQDGSLLARDVIAAYEAADTALQGVAATARATGPKGANVARAKLAREKRHAWRGK
jgi:hypothetical protein